MTPENFCYWLQGAVELQMNAPSEEQWQIIRDHLQLVFDKKTPARMNLQTTMSEDNSPLPYTLSDDHLLNNITC